MSGVTATVGELARWAGAELVGDPETPVRGFCHDSRSCLDGNLFLALQGERVDGHAFLPQAVARGAAAALVTHVGSEVMAWLKVDDVRLALGRLAAAWLARLATPCVAITGSNGKTTVKELLAAILGRMGPVHATQGNLNNDLGVPYTLLAMEASARFGVIEMGANHAGEIAYLTDLVRPRVTVLNNAGPAHLEGFGSLEGVARAKGEIMGGLVEGGCAVLNRDDPFFPLWRELAGEHDVLSFGSHARADVRLLVREPGRLRIATPGGEVETAFRLTGEHNAKNALAACAGALAMGADLDALAGGLADFVGTPGRMQPVAGRGGAHLIDDSYNANPGSVEVAVKWLAAQPGRRLLVLGDMAELGADGAELHRQVGEWARAAVTPTSSTAC